MAIWWVTGVTVFVLKKFYGRGCGLLAVWDTLGHIPPAPIISSQSCANDGGVIPI